jgi:F-type H+-transporting ATPase subunit b
MDETLQALTDLLLQAVPTFILVLAVHFYLKAVFYRPMDGVLKARDDATEGARRAAQASLKEASRKAAEYEAAIQAARNDIYRQQEESRRKWRQEHAATLEESRRKASETVKDARNAIAQDVADAKPELAAQSDQLAAEIVESILKESVN